MASPTPAAGALVSFQITTNGTPVASTFQIGVWTALGTIPRARVAVYDGADQTFAISSSATFAPGASIAIALGYEGTHTTVFNGTIAAQKIEIDETGNSRLIVEAIAKDIAVWSGSVPPPVLSLVYGDSILALNATTLDGETAKTGGEVRFAGSALAVPGAAMTLDGLGDRFDGTALITGVNQSVAEGQWTTTATYGAAPSAR
ncbi:MAG TPA: hypothetical protein VHZ78_11735 [Rhizomicrobium sp.]|jgi:phage protein D|nr:hypothetical protein [Rhizomicrobium sp.]